LGNSDNVPSDGSTLSSGGIDGFSYIFTMDNVSASVDSFYIYTSGSRRAGTSTSGRSGNSYTTLLDAGIIASLLLSGVASMVLISLSQIHSTTMA
jgi:hypothetical protein